MASPPMIGPAQGYDFSKYSSPPVSAPTVASVVPGPIIGKDRVTEMLKTMSPNTVMKSVYGSDPTFKSKVDAMQPFYTKQTPDWQSRFPTFALNKYYGIQPELPKDQTTNLLLSNMTQETQPAQESPLWHNYKNLLGMAVGMNGPDIQGYTGQNIADSTITQPFKIATNMARNAISIVKAPLTDPVGSVKGAVMPAMGAAEYATEKFVQDANSAYEHVTGKKGLSEPQMQFPTFQKLTPENPQGWITQTGPTPEQQQAYALADAFGLIQFTKGGFALGNAVSNLSQGKGTQQDLQTAVQHIQKGGSQLYNFAAENPVTAYLLGRGIEKGVGGALSAAGDSMPISSMGPSLSNLGNAVSNFSPAESLIAPIGKATLDMAGPVINKGVLPAYGMVAGLKPSTLPTIANDPEAYQQAKSGNLSIDSVSNKLGDAINTKEAQLSYDGQDYQTIRQSGQVATMPQDGVKGVLEQHGISIDAGGQVIQNDPEAIPLKAGDVKEIQQFMDTYGNKEELSANGILNARKYLDEMSKWGDGKTNSSTVIARDLRTFIDGVAKDQIDGLAEADTKYAPQIQELKGVRKEYLTPDGNLKDGVLAKIMNSTNPNKSPVLARLEDLVPGIGKDVRMLHALKDVQTGGGAIGQLIGTGRVAGLVASGLTGNAPGIIGTILSAPQVAVPLAQWYGELMGNSSLADDVVTKLNAGVPLDAAEAGFMTDAVGHFDTVTGSNAAQGPTQPTQPGGANTNGGMQPSPSTVQNTSLDVNLTPEEQVTGLTGGGGDNMPRKGLYPDNYPPSGLDRKFQVFQDGKPTGNFFSDLKEAHKFADSQNMGSDASAFSVRQSVDPGGFPVTQIAPSGNTLSQGMAGEPLARIPNTKGFVYHATDPSRVDSILKNGLQPVDGKIFLAPSPDIAAAAVSAQTPNPVILKIPVKAVSEAFSDPNMPKGVPTFYTTHPIPSISIH